MRPSLWSFFMLLAISLATARAQISFVTAIIPLIFFCSKRLRHGDDLRPRRSKRTNSQIVLAFPRQTASEDLPPLCHHHDRDVPRVPGASEYIGACFPPSADARTQSPHDPSLGLRNQHCRARLVNQYGVGRLSAISTLAGRFARKVTIADIPNDNDRFGPTPTHRLWARVHHQWRPASALGTA